MSASDYDALSDAETTSLIEYRGGCRCRDPNAMPPCSACTNPLNRSEEIWLKELRAESRETSKSTYAEYIRARNALGFSPGTAMRFTVWDGCELKDQIDMARQLTEGAAAHLKELEANKRPPGWGDW